MSNHPQYPIIALLSDFGWQDNYVGMMKGTIAQINPRLQVIDLNHQIPPQDIAAARFNLMQACDYFPKGTIYVAVVDPGVGGDRLGVGVQFAGGYLVGPDNGMFSGLLEQYPAIAAVSLTNTDYWRTKQPSATFHGRDIFAPAGAHLANGVPLSALGEPISPESLVEIALPQLRKTPQDIIGSIQYIDHFGNLITNIPAEILTDICCDIQVGSHRIQLIKTYGEILVGEMAGLIGSHGLLEVVVNQGNAQKALGATVGNEVKITRKKQID